MNPGVHAAIAAAHAAEKRKREQEEERMTRYNPEELDHDWEFKIVRSDSAIFRKPEALQQVREEEALSGWQLLEKLDNSRVRFKRPVSAAKRDAILPAGIDPYRTQVGGTGISSLMALAITALLFMGLGVLLFAAQTSEEPGLLIVNGINMVILFAVIILPILMMVFIRRNRG